MQHFNALTEAEQERLAVLIEECGEVVQAACKILRHGYESKNPDLPLSPTNRTNLEKELGDVSCAIMLMVNSQDIVRSHIEDARRAKGSRIMPYLHHQGAA